MESIHFISGLPRSGSTLLAAVLRQNPSFSASMSSPVSHIFLSTVQAMSAENRFHYFLDETKKGNILKNIFHAYYADNASKVIFDSNREWSSSISRISHIFPTAKLICCVRDIPWVLDSFELMVKKNPLATSRLFNLNPHWNVYDRINSLMLPTGTVGRALNDLREAYYGPEREKMLVLDYDEFVSSPRKTLLDLYKFIDEPLFEHDFGNIKYEEPEFDRLLGLPGLHTISQPISFRTRKSILPPDIIKKYQHLNFWKNPSGI